MRDVMMRFLVEYETTATYWYVPKARTISPETVPTLQGILRVMEEEFVHADWGIDTQNAFLDRLADNGLHEEKVVGQSPNDRAAGARILVKLFETLGLAFLEPESGLVTVTDAGINLILAEDVAGANEAIEAQIAKYQYPNPLLTGAYASAFGGLVAHLFLLQVLASLDNYLTTTEFNLFINLARQHEDLPRILQYIEACQRRLVPDAGSPTRFRRIALDSSYQRRFFGFPRYLAVDEDGIGSTDVDTVQAILEDRIQELAVPRFRTSQDWMAYFGDPERKPSWFTYLVNEIEQAATAAEAAEIVQQHGDQLDEEQTREVRIRQVEKAIETFYVDNLDLIEPGLVLLDDGRQYSTAIGRMDLLCQGPTGEYVIVEIKAGEANDSVFGQLLRGDSRWPLHREGALLTHWLVEARFRHPHQVPQAWPESRNYLARGGMSWELPFLPLLRYFRRQSRTRLRRQIPSFMGTLLA